MGSFIVWAIVIVIGLIMLLRAIRVVREYQRLVVFRLGRSLGAKGPGLVLLVPIIDRAVAADLRESYLEIPRQTCITRDNAPIDIDFLIYSRVIDPALSVIQVSNFAGASQGIATTTLRAVIGDIPLDDVLAKREDINRVLRAKLDEVTERWGVKVTSVEIREIVPPKDIQDAMNRQMSAERNRRAMVTESEGKRAVGHPGGGRGQAVGHPQGRGGPAGRGAARGGVRPGAGEDLRRGARAGRQHPAAAVLRGPEDGGHRAGHQAGLPARADGLPQAAARHRREGRGRGRGGAGRRLTGRAPPPTLGLAMPIYEYECQSCRKRFELLVRPGTEIACPSCGAVKVTRRLSAPAPVARQPKGQPPSCRTGAEGCDPGRCGSGLCGAR